MRISLAALTMAALAVAASSPCALAQGTEATIVVIVRLAPSAPAAPTIIPEPIYTFGTQNEVSWIASPSRSVTTYTIQCDNTPAFGGPAAQADVSSPALSQTFTNLSLGTAYWYRVRAKNQFGLTSDWSALTSSTQMQLYGLTVASWVPDNGVIMGVSPQDIYGQRGGLTKLTRTYYYGAAVTLNAPLQAPNNYLFYRWLIDGQNFSGNLSQTVQVLMNTSRTMTAIYHSDYPILTVASQNPDNGINIFVYPADAAGKTRGTTQFTRQYLWRSLPTLSAPPSVPNGWVFTKWLKDGANFPSNTYRDVLCSLDTDHTMTAIFAHPYNTALLAVASSSPASGTFVSVYPADKYNQTTGTTQFVCSYVPNSLVTLTARGNAPNGYLFSKWLRDGDDFPNNTYRDVLCSMATDHTMTAVYAHPYNTALLTVASSSPVSGAVVSVYPADKYNQTTGTTQFVCSYVPNSLVTLTARGTAPNGYVFWKWLRDGADFPNNTYRDVLCSMDGDHTMTAVYKP